MGTSDIMNLLVAVLLAISGFILRQLYFNIRELEKAMYSFKAEVIERLNQNTIDTTKLKASASELNKEVGYLKEAIKRLKEHLKTMDK